MNGENDSLNFKALAQFRFQVRKFLAVSADAAKEAGIDPTQHQLLLVIKGLHPEPAYVGDIAHWLMIRHNSAVELAKRCERNGWISRTRDEADRRQVSLQLTDKGESILNELSAVHMRELQATGPRLIASLQEILNADSLTLPE